MIVDKKTQMHRETIWIDQFGNLTLNKFGAEDTQGDLFVENYIMRRNTITQRIWRKGMLATTIGDVIHQHECFVFSELK